VTLITRLAGLAEAVIELRHAQRHAAQAAAARKAAEQLHAAARDHLTPPRERRRSPAGNTCRTNAPGVSLRTSPISAPARNTRHRPGSPSRPPVFTRAAGPDAVITYVITPFAASIRCSALLRARCQG
jgi:hypothetical protein